MITRLQSLHEISTVGKAQNFTTSNTPQLVTLSTDPKGEGPLMFVVVCDEDVHLRQGDSTVSVTTTDPILFKRTYYKITVDDENQAYLSVRWSSVNPAAGTFQAWQVNSLYPGDGASV